VGLAGGYTIDLLSLITRKSFPISSIRIKKFCANTVVRADKLQKIGFHPPYSLTEGIRSTISSDLVPNTHGAWCEGRHA
jgi:hypothetical protein